MIYLVRHGETEFNAERRQQGHMDSPLTALGRAQAHAVGHLLKRQVGGEDGWRIIASPLGRAQHTAQIIGEHLGLAVETDRRVIEVSFPNGTGGCATNWPPSSPTPSAAATGSSPLQTVRPTTRSRAGSPNGWPTCRPSRNAR